jgi:hypothetical protein
MRILKSIAFAGLAMFSVGAGILLALRFTRLQHHTEVALYPPAGSIGSQLTYPSRYTAESTRSISANREQANTLELPKASLDFVGYWGGYIHSSIQRFNPDLIGTSPDRISVIFGRQGDTVFMTSDLYTSPNQKIVHRPTARIVAARTVTIEYGSADKDLYYVCHDRFQLKTTTTMDYKGTIEVYDLNNGKLMSVVTQSAVLKQLPTAREQLHFARPGIGRIPRAEVSAKELFSSP